MNEIKKSSMLWLYEISNQIKLEAKEMIDIERKIELEKRIGIEGNNLELYYLFLYELIHDNFDTFMELLSDKPVLQNSLLQTFKSIDETKTKLDEAKKQIDKLMQGAGKE